MELYLNDRPVNLTCHEFKTLAYFIRDDERRRIARELHDSVGQLVAAMAMNSAPVEAESHRLTSEAAKCVAQNATLIEEIGKQVRTISHLLHPPLLDEAGLASALRWYVEGFAARSKIDARLEIPTSLQRLPSDIELTLFRVVQECLTNVHRHSGSPTATIRLLVDGPSIRVEIQDAGKGLAHEKAFESSCQAGVGLRGMHERLRLIGGTLKIHSDVQGTHVIATAPIPASTIPAAPIASIRALAKTFRDSPATSS